MKRTAFLILILLSVLTVFLFSGCTASAPVKNTPVLPLEPTEESLVPSVTVTELCDVCKSDVKIGSHGEASCGVKGHFVCDSLLHGVPLCNNTSHCISDGLNHEKADCLAPHHYNCRGDHGIASCGISYHRLCDGISHAPMPCGYNWHCISDGLPHLPASCGVDGHFECFENHAPAVCGAEGHLNCDGRIHATRPCKIAGHCYSDGLDHSYIYVNGEKKFLCE
ncbi:MAG: hypothetical protein IJ323_05055 [Clostridia bacterium]|nr:hypothetical protein [Clostridia bacterium]MBQ7897776.1 hypothetical protein [Clostridia bacterium]